MEPATVLLDDSLELVMRINFQWFEYKRYYGKKNWRTLWDFVVIFFYRGVNYILVLKIAIIIYHLFRYQQLCLIDLLCFFAETVA